VFAMFTGWLIMYLLLLGVRWPYDGREKTFRRTNHEKIFAKAAQP
jgi:hypothetical protein